MVELEQRAQQLAQCLAAEACRIVFAESCTAGLASAALGAIAGISAWHCGSAVVYREQTKQDWLGVSTASLAAYGAVSRETTEQMVHGVLARTREADIGAAITGHLGPDAPSNLDGVVFTAVARRSPPHVKSASIRRHELHAPMRSDRQLEAATLLLQHVCEALAGNG